MSFKPNARQPDENGIDALYIIDGTQKLRVSIDVADVEWTLHDDEKLSVQQAFVNHRIWMKQDLFVSGSDTRLVNALREAGIRDKRRLTEIIKELRSLYRDD